MARKKISEFKAKYLLTTALSHEYSGISATVSDVDFSHLPEQPYVVKVDQGVKKRFKKGLVLLNIHPSGIPEALQQLSKSGFSKFIIEPQLQYDQTSERYLSFLQEREGIAIVYSTKGGVNIEENQDALQKCILATDSKSELSRVAAQLSLDESVLSTLIHTFKANYFSFLEINPFIFLDGKFIMLDAAVEVDDTAEFFVQGAWTSADYVEEKEDSFPEVMQVKQLASKSQAAFSLTVLNPNGSLGMLLSSGGASIVIADEAGNLGYGNEIINYGEYSGNPNAEETYLYAKSILSLLLTSTSPKKALIIAGAVANFTDIRTTFTGVITALSEVAPELRAQQIKVFVRRGGPNQKEGLSIMRAFLEKEQLLGDVKGPEMVLSDIVREAVSYIQ